MWRIALLSIAACAPTWTKPAYRSTAVAEARATAARDFQCPAERINFKRDATACGEQHTYGRSVTDSPYRDPSFQNLDAVGPLHWVDI